MDLNETKIIGRLAAEPELRSVTGKDEKPISVTNFTVAVNATNQKDGPVDYVPVVVWGKQGEACDKYLVTGQEVSITGRMRDASYHDKEGAYVPKKSELVASHVEFGMQPQIYWGKTHEEKAAMKADNKVQQEERRKGKKLAAEAPEATPTAEIPPEVVEANKETSKVTR